MTDRRWNRWPVTAPLTVGASAVLLLIFGIVTWGIEARLAGAVVAAGRVEVDRNRQIIQHPDGGVVTAVYVREGDQIEAGDILLQLDATALQSELSSVREQLFETLARRARLEAERDNKPSPVYSDTLRAAQSANVRALMDGQTRLFQARRDTLRSTTEQLALRRAQIARQIEGFAAQGDALNAQRALTAQELTTQEELLARGLTTAGTVRELQRQDAILRGNIGDLTAKSAEAAERMAEIDLRILGLAGARREAAITQLRDLQLAEQDLTERDRELQRKIRQTQLRAPVSGLVFGLRVFAPNTVIGPAEPLLYLVPQDRPLVIVAQVSDRDIDNVKVGQDVTLRFPAFDQRRSPALYGTVSVRGADVMTDGATSAAFYQTEIQIGRAEIARLPAGATLMPGMPVEVYLRTVDRSPVSYLLKPLTDFFSRSFRET